MMFRLTPLLLALCLVACRKPDVQRTDAVSTTEARKTRPAPPPVYDDEGIRLPQEDLPLGTPVPVGLSSEHEGTGWVRYSGPVHPDEVIAFYRKYLTLPDGMAPHEVGTSTRFLDARPKQPGNPGRPVEVRILRELKAKWSAVLIFDLSAINKAREKDWDAIPLVDPREWKPSKPGEKVPSELL
jgi:hypothetical protein